MNKEEVIAKIQSLKPNNEIIEKYYSEEELKGFKMGFEEAKIKSSLIVNKLNNLEKVFVTKDISDWIEVCKEILSLTLSDAMNPNILKINNLSEKTIHWITTNQETFAKAWLYGYEVQKEKMYTVKLPNPNDVSGRHFILRRDTTGKIVIERYTCEHWRKSKDNRLTESEIKKDFPWLWQFAEEVIYD